MTARTGSLVALLQVLLVLLAWPLPARPYPRAIAVEQPVEGYWDSATEKDKQILEAQREHVEKMVEMIRPVTRELVDSSDHSPPPDDK